MSPRWSVVAGIIIAAMVLLEMVFRHPGHAVFWWHKVPAFDVLLGTIGSIGLVLGAKWLGHTWLERPPDYYGDDAS